MLRLVCSGGARVSGAARANRWIRRPATRSTYPISLVEAPQLQRYFHQSSRVASNTKDESDVATGAPDPADSELDGDETTLMDTKVKTENDPVSGFVGRRKKRMPLRQPKSLVPSDSASPRESDTPTVPKTSLLMPLMDSIPVYEGSHWSYELNPHNIDRNIFYMRTHHVVLAYLRKPNSEMDYSNTPTEPFPTDSLPPAPSDTDSQESADQAPSLDFHRIGYLARVRWSADATKITFFPQCRVRISNLRLLSSGMTSADIQPVEDAVHSDSDIKAIQEQLHLLRDPILSMLASKPQWSSADTAKDFLAHLETSDPISSVNQLCQLISGDSLAGLVDFQRLVSALNARERLDVLTEYLSIQALVFKKELEVSKMAQVSQDDEKQREVFQNLLNEAQQEWSGAADLERRKLIDRYRKRLESLVVPPEVLSTIDEQITRLSYFEPAQSEYGLTVAYLDVLTQLPWGVYTKDNFDLEHARNTLDSDHFGLKDVKERILEFIAVSNITGNVQGKILCFVGPPGTGKTSIARSIAASLGRKYARISLGGMNDIHEIKGHRRTYVGAMPGQIVKMIKQAQTSNPLILLDEIDKASNVRGDAATALLEVLDPSQNNNFMDSYLDVPIDLSKVLFVCTANRLSQIPAPLLDRMEVVHLDGYLEEEKFQIAKRHLIPAAIQRTNLSELELSISESALREVVKHYGREPGVRDLKQLLEKAFDKASLSIARGEAQSVKVSTKNLVSFLGPPPIIQLHHYAAMPPGLCFSLSEYGVQHVEASIHSTIMDEETDESRVFTTGKADQVVKESGLIAYTYARNYLYAVDPRNRFFETWSIHIHLPEGAQEKTGTGAGCAIATSLLSLASKTPTRKGAVVAGELTLTGKILPVSNIKALTLAARRHEATDFVLPKANQPDWEELDSSLKADLRVHFAEWYSDVCRVMFGNETALSKHAEHC